MGIPPNLMDRCWRHYELHSVTRGIEPSQLEFVSGFAAAVGVMAGTMEVGIPLETRSKDLLNQLIEEVWEYRAKLPDAERVALDRTRRMNKLMG